MRFFAKFTTALIALVSISTVAFAQSKGFDTTRMDNSVEACNDFYQYANGNWIKNTKIPAEYPSWGSFTIVYENNQNVLKQVVENAAKTTNAAKGSDTQLVGDYYASCMDEAAIEKAGTAPLQPFLAEVGKVETAKDLQREIAEFHNRGFGGFFRFGIGADDKNSNVNLAGASQGGIGLPNRDYWFNTDAKSIETRGKYLEYVTNVFKLAGDTPEQAAAEANTVTVIQKRFASAAKPPVELRDSEANYNKKTLAELAQLTPNFSWTDYLKARGIGSVKDVNIGQPKYFEEMSKMLKDVPVSDWKTYLRWLVVANSVSNLPKAFRDEQFNFYSKYLFGVQQQQARWKICTQNADSVIGESLGQEFVKTSFSPAAKTRMNELIDNLFAAYKERIQKLDWMSDATKQKALEKLAAYTRKIGYPDKLKGYKGLNLSRDSYFQNNLRASEFEIKRNLEKASKPVDKTEWGMTPPTVNAYNNSQFNEIVFPAGILQPPFFNAAAVDALNYGGIGAVIGHEITHGFDDEGSKYDASGNLKSWWTDADRKTFDERTSCVVNQFSKYKVGGDVFMNGKLTLGENTADLGGLTMAFAAFEKSMEGKPKPAPINGFTPEQLFFLGWAQVWAEVSTPQGEAYLAQNDAHSIARFRVNGPLSNMPEFSQAFGCKANTPMVRTDICKIW
ncbi:MAG: M13 family metallopeptidase [Acidobacteriota bacterium]|nr:M13 family metallopeptidase [Acidobacteriota bacterium]